MPSAVPFVRITTLISRLVVCALLCVGLAIGMVPALPATATALDATGTTFNFGAPGQPVTISANLSRALPVGTSLTYSEVATISGAPLDAVVTFVGGTNLRGSSSQSCDPGCIRRLDLSTTDSDSEVARYLEQQINRSTSGSGGLAEIRVDFFLSGTSTPATLSNLEMHVYDIDNSQGLEIDGMASYSVSTNTHLTITARSGGSVRFVAPASNTSQSAPALTAYTVGRVTARYASTSSVTYRLLSPNNSNDHNFAVDFSAGVAWTDNVGGAERAAVGPFAWLSPSIQTVSGIRNCPLAMAPLTASNFGGAVTYASTSGTTPPGLAFSSTTGVFSGAPTGDSSATVGITGTGSVSGSATAQVTFAIANPTMTLTPGTQTVSSSAGAAITATSMLTASNSCSTVTYAVTSGTLPVGLTLDPATGAVYGTPSGASSGTVTVSATDSINRAATATITFDIAAATVPEVSLPPGVSQLITQPVPPPSTTTPSTTVPPTTPTTTVPVAPVPAPSGDLPELDSTQTLVIENGEPVTVELVVENDEALVLRSQDFELRLRGNCTTGCAITEDTTGRATIHLDRSGAARVSGFGFLPGSLVHVWIFSEPRYLGALLVAADGTYDGSFALDDIEVGGHTLQANGFSFDNAPRSANLGIVVVDNTLPSPTPTVLPTTGSGMAPSWLAALLVLLGVALSVSLRRRAAID